MDSLEKRERISDWEGYLGGMLKWAMSGLDLAVQQKAKSPPSGGNRELLLVKSSQRQRCVGLAGNGVIVMLFSGVVLRMANSRE